MQQIRDRGRNIKCYDKIKLTHNITQYRLHSVEFQCKTGSFNQAVTCHKVRDQTDWFVVLMAQQSKNNESYHIQYGDKILLSNSKTKKYLHLSPQFESPVSKNQQVSLCFNGNGGPGCLQDQWVVELYENGQDQYWRVGQSIKLKNHQSQTYLCSARRRIKQNGDNEVYCCEIQTVKELPLQKNESRKNKPESPQKEKVSPVKSMNAQEQSWMVSQLEPCFYTANISSKKSEKRAPQAIQYEDLKKVQKTIPKKIKKRSDQLTDILTLENLRVAQIQDQRKKRAEQYKKNSCWKKYLCCLCFRNDQYQRLL